jgi:protein-L-isoaspartate(D-aspartate) O-methyltransferase
MRQGLIKKLIAKGITDSKVLAAFDKIPRHYFFESAFLEQAYQDIAFPIGEGQTISQPYTVAFQTQLLEVKKDDKILEIGTGSGFQTCILCALGARVFTIECNKVLFNKTRQFIPKVFNFSPVFYCGDGTKGMPAYAPFDKIIVTAGGPFIPESLMLQLSIGGILVIPVGDEKSQKMLRVIRVGEKEFEKEEFGDFKFVKLLGKEGW